MKTPQDKSTVDESVEMDDTAPFWFQMGIKVGEQAQQKGVYSEADLITYLEWVGEMGWYYEKDKKQWVHDDELGMFKSTKDLIDYYPIQSLNQEYIELEKISDIPSKEVMGEFESRIKTDRDSDGQLMAYLKK